MTAPLKWRSQLCPCGYCPDGTRIEWRYSIDIRFRPRRKIPVYDDGPFSGHTGKVVGHEEPFKPRRRVSGGGGTERTRGEISTPVNRPVSTEAYGAPTVPAANPSGLEVAPYGTLNGDTPPRASRRKRDEHTGRTES